MTTPSLYFMSLHVTITLFLLQFVNPQCVDADALQQPSRSHGLERDTKERTKHETRDFFWAKFGNTLTSRPQMVL